jgi:hypothetical protein
VNVNYRTPSGNVRFCTYRTVRGWSGFVEGSRCRIDAGERETLNAAECYLLAVLENRHADLF